MATPARRKLIAEAVARLKAKRKEAGLVRLELWVQPDSVEDIKAYAAWVETQKEA